MEAQLKNQKQPKKNLSQKTFKFCKKKKKKQIKYFILHYSLRP